MAPYSDSIIGTSVFHIKSYYYFYLYLVGFKQIENSIKIYSTGILGASRNCIFKRQSNYSLG